MLFYWDDWNEAHIGEDGVSRDEAEQVVKAAGAGYPLELTGGKFLVRGRSVAGRALQVIFVYRPVDTIDWLALSPGERVLLEKASVVFYVIHARDLIDREKRRVRRRRR